MVLKGKKLVFLGDSITVGVCSSGEGYRYWELLAKRTGATCVGFGISGTTIAPQINPNPDWPHHFQHFNSRVNDMDADADVVVVYGGVNDYIGGDAPIGRLEDRTEATFYGALHVLYTHIFERYPNAQLIVMGPNHCIDEHAGSRRDSRYNFTVREHSLADYVQAVRDVTEYYGIPLLDLFKCAEMQPAVPSIREKFLPDGLHPNDAGHQRLADRLYAFLQTLE